MKSKYTKKYMLDNKGCYSTEQIGMLSFINKESISINDILDSEISLKDKCRWVVNNCELTDDKKRELAFLLAKDVVEIYNKKYPNDKRVSDCIKAIEKYNQGKISMDELKTARAAAANAAYYATYAANAANAAANANAANATDAADANKKYQRRIIKTLKKIFI